VIRSVYGLLVLVAVLGLVGCGPSGPSTVPVKGTLTIDGQPADNVSITLSPLDSKLPTASGQVKNGAFQLFTGSQGKPGAVPGKYKVVLSQMQTASPEELKAMYVKGGGPPPSPKRSFAEKYTQASTSDKEVEVKSGPNDLKIDVAK